MGANRSHAATSTRTSGATDTKPLRILLADDHVIFRQGIRTLLERYGFEIVAEADDGREAIRLAQEVTPDVAILDLAMPQLSGSEAAQEITRVSPNTRAILLTMYSEEPYVAKALQVGITGYVLKTQSSADLLQAISDVMAGGIYLSPGISQAIVNAYLARHELSSHPLTVREREVLRLVATGQTNHAIATERSPRTSASVRKRQNRIACGSWPSWTSTPQRGWSDTPSGRV